MPGTTPLRSMVTWLVQTYQLLKPKTHNRIAWFVVATGSTMVAGPFWEPYLHAWAENFFGIHIDTPTNPSFGLALVALGLLYHFGAMRIESIEKIMHKNDINAHSREQYKKFKSILSEEAIERILGNLIGDHSIYNDSTEVLRETLAFLRRTGGMFLDKEMHRTAQELRDAMENLVDFIGSHFFVFPSNQHRSNYRMCMQPEWNVDRATPNNSEIAKYEALTKRLEELIKLTQDKYKHFTKCAHESMGISAIQSDAP